MADEPTTATTGIVLPAPQPTDPAALEAEIVRRRERLAATVDELIERAKPQAIAKRSAADAKAKVQSALTTPDGAPRKERIVAVVAAVVALVALFLTARARTKR